MLDKLETPCRLGLLAPPNSFLSTVPLPLGASYHPDPSVVDSILFWFQLKFHLFREDFFWPPQQMYPHLAPLIFTMLATDFMVYEIIASIYLHLLFALLIFH